MKLPDDVILLQNMFKFFEKRKISKKVVLRNKIEIIPKHYFSNVKVEKKAICFKYLIGDECFNIKYRSPDKDFMQHSGGAKLFYKLNDIALENEVIITEGEFDALKKQDF